MRFTCVFAPQRHFSIFVSPVFMLLLTAPQRPYSHRVHVKIMEVLIHTYTIAAVKTLKLIFSRIMLLFGSARRHLQTSTCVSNLSHISSAHSIIDTALPIAYYLDVH